MPSSNSSVAPHVRKRAADKLFPAPNPHLGDPIGWLKKRTKEFAWSKQREIMESVARNRFTAVQSCHGPGKSFIASRLANWWIDSHALGEAFLLSTAPTDAQVKSILWREMARAKRKAHVAGRITLEAKWYQGEKAVDEELIGMGRKPQDYDEQAFQGIHARYVLVIVDEASGIPKNLWDAIDSIVTNETARVLAIGNPDNPASHFKTLCSPGSGYNVIKISAFETPAFTGERVPADLLLDLVSKQWVDERRLAWGEGSPLYVSKVLGEFPDVSEDTLIPPSWIKRAQEKQIEPKTLGRYALDVARYGSDETILGWWRDGHYRMVKRASKQDTMRTVGMVVQELAKHGENPVGCAVDVIGIGAGVFDRLLELDFNVVAFDAGSGASNPRRFRNLRAEAWWKVREEFEADQVDLDPEDDALATQLGQIKYWVDSWGRINIESKEQMKKRGLSSPDRADALMMGCHGAGGLLHYASYIPLPTLTGDLMSKVM